MTPTELVQSLAEGGYSGCVLTNHFFKGNSGIDRNLPWNDFVAEYEKDYLECQKAAQTYNLDIIFGIEEHLFDGLEILCYGITPQILYQNQHLRDDHSLKTWSDTLHRYGALCIQAHPYRDREYVKNPRPLSLDLIDGIEVYNYCNQAAENELAQELASQNPQLILVSGADAHKSSILNKAGIKTTIRITDEKTLVDVLKSGDYDLIK